MIDEVLPGGESGGTVGSDTHAGTGTDTSGTLGDTNADGFIESLESGYDSFIAEKGASLSGGQKQRISIARALTRKPEILILDDATSALDLATEARLRVALREALRDTTVVLIAQRIASVLHADRIAVIEDGTVVDCAPHGVLLSR